MIQFHTTWYGWDSTCIKCGRNWQDGEWMDLPFANGLWGMCRDGKRRPMTPRNFQIAQAKARYRAMPPKTENDYALN
jgi:hypothetical protein